jgi:putative metallohydrolase (TIGR04338 family)
MKTQQFDCYAAEAALGDGRAFRGVDEAQRWVDDLRDTPWWQLQGYGLHVLRIEVGLADARKLGKDAVAVGWYERSKNAGRVEFKRSALNESTVLHEVAHVLASAVHGSKSHDPAWARTYLTLVSCVIGPDAYVTLQRSFDAHGVDYDAPPAPATSGIAL